MPESKYYLKFHIVGLDKFNNPIDKKYKSIRFMIDDIADRCHIYNRQTVYKIINGYFKVSHNEIRIYKIRELITKRNSVSTSITGLTQDTRG
jgi:hypothetical protein